MTREPREGWVDTGQVKIHYLDWPGADPVLLCVHGLTANCRSFDLLADEVGDHHRVIAVDLRGRGLSDKPDAGNYGYAAHARDLAALLRSLGIRRAAAVGWSMGTYVSIALAAENPDLVSHLVLIDGGGVGKELNREELDKQRTSYQRLSTVYPSMEAYTEFYRKSAPWVPWTKCLESFLEADVERRPDGSVVCRARLEGILEDIEDLLRWDLSKVAPRVSAPALALWAPIGLLDPAQPLFARSTVEEVARLLPQGRLVTVEGANHMTIGLDPVCMKKVVVAMESFLG